jgi:hypothetical protein
MQRQHVLLRLALNRNEPHRWPSYRFADRFGVARIILVRPHVWPHEARTHQPDLVTAPGLGDLPRQGSMRPSLQSLAKDAENRFHRCGDRAMSVHDGRGIKPLPEKEISLEH